MVRKKQNKKYIGMKCNINLCHLIAKDKGGRCVGGTYKNNRSKMQWECKFGHKWFATLNSTKDQDSWCKICAGKSKYTIDICHKIAKKRNGICLETKYNNNCTDMKWECKFGHIFTKDVDHIINHNQWCSYCYKTTYTIKECQTLAESKGGRCTSSIYINNKIPLNWECGNCMTNWTARLDNILYNNTWCPTCADTKYTIEDCKKIAIEKGGQCISNTYINVHSYLDWICGTCNNSWPMYFANIIRGSWCPYCSKRMPLTISYCKQLAREKGGRCLSKEYNNVRNKLLWECEFGHVWFATLKNVKYNNTWCSRCSGFRSEEKCREIFEQLLSIPFNKVRPRWLRESKANNCLELDGYNEDLNLAFEYHGKQHYEYIPHFHRNGPSDLVAQQHRDRIKKEICERKGITIIEIPYYYTHINSNAMRSYIINELIEFFEIKRPFTTNRFSLPIQILTNTKLIGISEGSLTYLLEHDNGTQESCVPDNLNTLLIKYQWPKQTTAANIIQKETKEN